MEMKMKTEMERDRKIERQKGMRRWPITSLEIGEEGLESSVLLLTLCGVVGRLLCSEISSNFRLNSVSSCFTFSVRLEMITCDFWFCCVISFVSASILVVYICFIKEKE
jgi:hypothetical protein